MAPPWCRKRTLLAASLVSLALLSLRAIFFLPKGALQNGEGVPLNVDCLDAIELQLSVAGPSVSGTFSGVPIPSYRDYQPPCSNWGKDGVEYERVPVVWYKFRGTGAILMVDAPYLAIFASDDCQSIRVPEDAVCHATHYEFRSQSKQNYYLLVGATCTRRFCRQSFDVSIRSRTAWPLNDSCRTALEVSSTQNSTLTEYARFTPDHLPGVWYVLKPTIPGMVRLRLQPWKILDVYSGGDDCDNLHPIPQHEIQHCAECDLTTKHFECGDNPYCGTEYVLSFVGGTYSIFVHGYEEWLLQPPIETFELQIAFL